MHDAAYVVVGLVLGAVFVWLLARSHAAALSAQNVELRTQLATRQQELTRVRDDLGTERAAAAAAAARLEETRRNLDEQRQLLDDARAQLADTFKALSGEALQQSSSAFLQQAQQSLEPLRDAVDRYQRAVQQLEVERQGAYSSLEAQVTALRSSSDSLQREAGNLVVALRSADVRGRWGELTLRRVAELAGMAEHCDFVEQATAEGESGRLRPDMIVRLPAGRQIVVDAKVPLSAYLDAAAATTDDERRRARDRHAQQVRKHVQLLGDKDYWEPFGRSLDLVVMFIPGESFFGAAVEADADLIEYAIGRRVVIATPMTLVALLRAVEMGWREERLAAAAQTVTDEGRELHKRVTIFLRHFTDVGAALGKATGAYNSAVGSLQSRVLPAARRLRDLTAATDEEPPRVVPIEALPQELVVPELPPQLTTESPAEEPGA